MSLTKLEIEIDEPLTDADHLPEAVRRLIDDGTQRIRDYMDRGEAEPGFVPSDFLLVYQTLAFIERRGIATGSAFCEWGSGFGVVACLASQLGFDTSGIEIEPELIEHAQDLADDHDINVEYVCGSFVPTSGESITDTTTDMAWLRSGGSSGYDELGQDIDDFDIIFAYPWPGEEQTIANLFDQFAARGALLVTYHGMDAMLVRRKV